MGLPQEIPRDPSSALGVTMPTASRRSRENVAELLPLAHDARTHTQVLLTRERANATHAARQKRRTLK